MNEEQLKALTDKIEGLKTGVEKNVHDLQEASEAKNEELKTNLSAKIDEQLGKIEEMAKKIDDSDAARKELELLISRKQDENGTDEVIGDPEVAAAFTKGIRTGSPSTKEQKVAGMVELIRLELPHVSEDDALNQAKSMFSGSNPDGGYLCPVAMAKSIITRLFESSPMRDYATVVKTTAGSMVFPIDDESFGVGWTGEVDTRSESDTAQIGEKTIHTHEMYAYPKMSLQLLEDSNRNMDQYFAEKVGDNFARLANTAFVTGNGVGRPFGFLAKTTRATNTYARGTVYERDTDGAAIDAADLIDLQGSLLEGYMSKAMWLMNRAIFTDIAQLVDSNGAFLINPRLLFEGFKPQILGHKVGFMSDMPNDQTTGGKVIAFGDWKKAYTILDRIGIMAIRDMLTSPGFLKVHFRMRLGADALNTDAYKILAMK